jgi:hypothetical protein
MTKKIKLILSYFSLFLILNSSLFASDFSHLDPEHLIPENLLKTTLEYFESHLSRIPNKHFIGIIDFKQHNSKERFFIVDMESGHVEKYLVAHGRNSDPHFSGYATKFSNIMDSKMTSLGFYLTGKTYFGEHGLSLRLDGLSVTNSLARERAIVIHAADYVAPGDKIGRSFGCPAIENRFHQLIIGQLKEGSLLYAAY